MRIAYADPPYPRQAQKHYSHDPRCAEVDHAALIADLQTYDGWALSSGADLHALQYVVPLLPEGTRCGVWVKPFASFKPNVNPAFAWEPVYFKPARKRGREVPTIRDWCAVNVTLQKGLSGVKPMAFCLWLFEALGADPSDEFVDLFPGSGAVTDAWGDWCHTRDLFTARLGVLADVGTP
jgi:hypothetical protein